MSFIIPSAAASLVTIVVLVIRVILSVPVASAISDGFFVAGAAVTAFSLFRFVGSEGVFDPFLYLASRLGNFLGVGASSDSYIDFKEKRRVSKIEQGDTKTPTRVSLFVGLIYLFAGILIAFLA